MLLARMSIDPRSGEVLSAHILIWPSVLDYFSKYYYALFGTVDPEAARLPLPTDKQGRLLSYVVAHEVGPHAWPAAQPHRIDRLFRRARCAMPRLPMSAGPNSSIMAYGRFNQVAQPGDGVTQLFAKLGPYDFAAIAWGYGQFGKNAAMSKRRRWPSRRSCLRHGPSLNWAAGEMHAELKDFMHDPRVQRENTGAERIDATRLGVANILRSLAQLDEATGGDDELFTSTLAVMLEYSEGAAPVGFHRWSVAQCRVSEPVCPQNRPCAR